MQVFDQIILRKMGCNQANFAFYFYSQNLIPAKVCTSKVIIGNLFWKKNIIVLFRNQTRKNQRNLFPVNMMMKK